MKKEYIAIYQGDIDLLNKGETNELIFFDSAIIDGEMWFIMRGKGNEDFRYPASVVIADDDWIVVDKNILSVNEQQCILFRYDPEEISVEDLMNLHKYIEKTKIKNIIFIPKSIDADIFDYKQQYIEALKEYLKELKEED